MQRRPWQRGDPPALPVPHGLTLEPLLDPRPRPVTPCPLDLSSLRFSLDEVDKSGLDFNSFGRSSRRTWSPLHASSSTANLSVGGTLPLDVTFDALNSTAEGRVELDPEFEALWEKHVALEALIHDLESRHRALEDDFKASTKLYEQRVEAQRLLKRNNKFHAARIQTLEFEVEDWDSRYTTLWTSSSSKLKAAREGLEGLDKELRTLRAALPLRQQACQATALQLGAVQAALVDLERRAAPVEEELVIAREALSQLQQERVELEQAAEEAGLALDCTQHQLALAGAEQRRYREMGSDHMLASELALLQSRLRDREARQHSLQQEMACEKATAQREMDSLLSLLDAICSAHGSASEGGPDGVLERTEALLARKAADVTELVFVCDRLLAEQEGLAV